MSINLSDLSDGPYLVADEFTAGTKLPASGFLTIERIAVEEVPVPNSKKKNKKGIVYFRGAKKAWCANKTELRKLGRIFGATKNIDQAWLGGRVRLVIVDNVRRPDNTYGNAIRVDEALAPGPAPAEPVPQSQTTTAPAEPSAQKESA
jgi:hypothetical protein